VKSKLTGETGSVPFSPPASSSAGSGQPGLIKVSYFGNNSARILHRPPTTSRGIAVKNAWGGRPWARRGLGRLFQNNRTKRSRRWKRVVTWFRTGTTMRTGWVRQPTSSQQDGHTFCRNSGQRYEIERRSKPRSGRMLSGPWFFMIATPPDGLAGRSVQVAPLQSLLSTHTGEIANCLMAGCFFFADGSKGGKIDAF
jgi:hypothetical protein